MNQRSWLKLDLLRDRRRLAGIPEPVIVPAASVVRQGAWYGLIPIALVILGCSLLVLRYGWLQQQQAVLLPQAEQSDQLLARLNGGASALLRLQKSNQSLSTALLNIKTGSAFLSEVSRIVPAGVQLKSLEDQGDSLLVSGLAFQPDGLAVLNGMQIKMARSLFFEPDSVVLIKAVEQNDDSAVAKILSSFSNGVNLGPIETPTPIAFEIRASFSAEMATKVIPQLRELGAFGAARRVDLIRSRMNTR